MSRLFFIPGRSPEISLIELDAILALHSIQPTYHALSREVFIIEAPSLPDPALIQTRAGGLIKSGIVLEEYATLPDADQLAQCILDRIPDRTKRITFGLSAYTLTRGFEKEKTKDGFSISAKSLRDLGLAIKKKLRGDGYSARFIASDTGSFLSSVSVSKNGLLAEQGCELILMSSTHGYILGVTKAVQEFEEYSFRDWNRPHRDMQTGLIPPKLAKIMVNLSRTPHTPSASILDPFCGYGTILQEATLLGYNNLYGSDLDESHVKGTAENLEWLERVENLKNVDVALCQADAQELSTIYTEPLDTIVTEPFLGPVIHKGRTISAEQMRDLSSLYIKFIKEASHILKKGGRLVVVFPFWRARNTLTFAHLGDSFEKYNFKNETIPAPLTHLMHTSERGSLLYARPDQMVGRELFILTKR